MMNNRCYICGEELPTTETIYHKKCTKKLFHSQNIPTLHYTQEELNELAKNIIAKRVSVPGVQPKLSLHLEKKNTGTDRLTLVGLEGNYILKPQTEQWKHVPEAEHFCMLFARLCNIETADFGLIPLKSGELSFITRRMDRTEKGSLHMEDFCQLSNKMTAQKYNGSMEQIGKLIRIHSSVPGLDLIRLFEITIFSFLTGNSDMHLKNFSLIQNLLPEPHWQLSQFYDLVPVKIILPADTDELALMLNGKKSKLTKTDFFTFGEKLDLSNIQIKKTFEKMLNTTHKKLEKALSCSFIPIEMKEDFRELFADRWNRVG